MVIPNSLRAAPYFQILLLLVSPRGATTSCGGSSSPQLLLVVFPCGTTSTRVAPPLSERLTHSFSCGFGSSSWGSIFSDPLLLVLVWLLLVFRMELLTSSVELLVSPGDPVVSQILLMAPPLLSTAPPLSV